MKHSDKDKFEQFFQDNLKDYKSSPSDDFWMELEDRIPPPPKSSLFKKVGGWIGVLLGIILLFSVTQWWQHKKEIAKISQTLESQEEKITSVSNDLKNTTTNKSQETTTSLPKEKEVVDFQKTKISSFQKTNKVNNTPTNNIFKKNINENIKDVNVLLQAETKTTKNKNNFSSKLKEVSTKSETPRIAEVEIEEINSLNTLLDIPVESKEIDKPPFLLLDFSYPKANRSFEIYRNYSWLYPKIGFKDQGIQSVSLPSRNIDMGILYGIKVTKRLMVQFGINYGKEHTGLQFRKFLNYAENETFIDNNVALTQYTYQFDTNYGKQVFDSFILNEKLNDGQDVVTNDAFYVDLQVKRIQQYLAVPVVVKYFCGNEKKRLTGNLKFGIMQKFIFIEDQIAEVDAYNISESRLNYERTDIKTIDAPTTRNLNFILGAGLEYKLDRQLIFVVEPNIKKSIFGFDGVSPYTLGIYTGLRWDIFQ